MVGAGQEGQGLPMQLRWRALGSEAVVDTSSSFWLGYRHYLARPSGFKRHSPNTNKVEKNDQASLATIFRVQENQTIKDKDDAFHPSFLQEVIFGGADDVHLESNTRDMFEAWETLHVTFLPHLSISNGPYYVKEDSIHSIWRVYEDRQLAFVQAIWPSIEDKT